MAINKILNVLVLGVIIMIGVIFFTGAMSATDEGIDMDGNAYENTYNTTTSIAIQSMSLMNILLILIGVSALVVVIMTFGKGV